MPYLRLFGGASLMDDDGPLTGPAAQRHRLALLAVLAARHPLGVPRIRAMELLWPDRDAKRARNLLNQAVHQLRKALGRRTIRSVGDELHLDPGRLSSDLLEYREAVEASELRHAVELQAGPFLDGFGLPGAPAFERWAARERARWQAELVSLLERLAEEEAAAGRHGAAVALRRRRVELDPYHGGGVLALMRALVADGDRAGALEVARAHRRRLREALDAAPDPDVEALADRLEEGDDASLDGRTPGAARLGPEPPPSSPDFGTPTEPRLVGRSEERERLEAAWRTAARGRTGLALIAGEAGIGKTRLAQELVAWAARRGALTASARFAAAEGRLAYGPVAQWLRSPALRASFSAVDAPWRSDLAPLLPELAGSGPGDATADLLTPPTDGRRQRFFRALAGAVLGRGEPRMLLIDDLQWSDPDTLQWLHFLLRFDPAAPLLVLGTVRSGELLGHHPLHAFLSEVRRQDAIGFTELEISPLGPEETAALGSAVARRELDPEERERLYRETEGHPLFVIEGVRAGLLAASADRSSRSGTDSLPTRVEAVIRARLARLSGDAREVTRVAATVGREFAPEVVADACGLSGEAVADALDELRERRIVRVAGDAIDFTHDKLREVVYAHLNPLRRRLLHERVAAAIEARSTDVNAVAGALASHRERAGDLPIAVSLYRRAAARARLAHGHEEAAGYLRRAVELLDSLGMEAEERARLELALQQQLGDCLLRTRGWAAPEVLAVHERERELSERVDDGRALCRALWGLQSVRMVRSELTEARSLGERLLGAARRQDDRLWAAAGRFVCGFASFLMGAFEDAAEQLERGLERYERLPKVDETRTLRTDVGTLLFCAASHTAWFLGDEETALARERQARAFADRLGNPFARAAALVYAALLHQYREEPGPAERRAVGAIAIAEEFGFPHYLATARVVRGWARGGRGDPGGGLAEIRSAFATYREIGSEIRRPYFLGLEARVRDLLGQRDRARDRVDEALALCGATGERWYEAELRRQRGDMAR